MKSLCLGLWMVDHKYLWWSFAWTVPQGQASTEWQVGSTLNQAVQSWHGSCEQGGWKVRAKSSSLWLQSGSCRSLTWVIPPSCGVCLVSSALRSLVQGRCEMCNPVYPARWSGRLLYRKCLVSVQPAQRLFYSCLAIHLLRCLRLLALVTVWGMQLPGCDVQWYVVYMLPPFPFEDGELCCVLPWTKLVLVMGGSSSLEIFSLKADWNPSVSHFKLNIWIWQWLQDNRTFSGKKCVEFLLPRVLSGLKDIVCTITEAPQFFTRHLNGKKPWLLKIFELYCSLWINFPIFSPPPLLFFFLLHVSSCLVHRHFPETSLAQKCTLIFWNVGEGVRGGSVNWQGPGDLGVSEFVSCGLQTSWGLPSPVSCVWFSKLVFLTPQSYLTALQFHSQIAFWCCHCWLLDSK